MEKIYLKVFALALFALLFSFTSQAQAAPSLTLSPISGNYKVGDTFKVNVYFEPSGETVDMIRANIDFPKDLVEIKDTYRNPVFKFPSGDNKLDNANGKFSYGAGIPGGASKGDIFLSLMFNVKKEGTAKIILNSDSLILKEGENIISPKLSIASFQLTKVAPVKAATPAPLPKVLGNKTPAPIKLDKSKLSNASTVKDNAVETAAPKEQQSEINQQILNSGNQTDKPQITSPLPSDSSWTSKVLNLRNIIIAEIFGLAIVLGLLYKLTSTSI